MHILGSKGCKCIDKYTINNIGIPSIVLMENAATEIFNYIKDYGDKVVVVVGTGNNGGDGLALARKLHLYGKSIDVYGVRVGQNETDDYKINYNILKNLGIDIKYISEDLQGFIQSIRNSDYSIDAIFGVGLSRNIEGTIGKIIHIINDNSKRIVSIDTPSGIDADSGAIKGIAIKANETYTVEVIKRGFLNYKALEFIGKVIIIKIGIPNSVKELYSEKIKFIEDRESIDILPIKKQYAHKGDFGKVVILAGSRGYVGAAFITAESAIRSGAGLVTVVIPDEIQETLASKLIEGMTINYNQKEKITEVILSANVIICGPGLGNSNESEEMLEFILRCSKCNLVLDADALNIISEKKELLRFIENRAIITPHLGEMKRLTGKEIKTIEEDRISIAKEYANLNKVIVLLKGYNTIITNGDWCYINPTGNSKMANGGMGDCLSGIIGSFIGQGCDLLKGTLVAAYIHGYIGDLVSEDNYVVTARDVIKMLPKTIELLKNRE